MNTHSKKRCSQIKNLEKRLLCLTQKYDQLTNLLEAERQNTSSDEGIIEYQNLIEERQLLRNHIDRLAQQVSREEKLLSTTPDLIVAQPGNTIHIQNSDHNITFRLVEETTFSDNPQISIDSPIGRAILGKRVGDNVIVDAPKGKIHYTILTIK